MSRRALGGVIITVLAVTVGASIWAWWSAWSAPLVSVVFRPTFSVEGISTGTPVRVKGVVVGQVVSLGLRLDAEGRLRPEVNLTLDPATLEDRGFADRLRGDQLHTEVERGLRVRLVSVNPASGLLQVELVWDATAPPPALLDRNEIAPLGGTMQGAMERIVKELDWVSRRDFAQIAEGMERELDNYFPKSNPEHAAQFSAVLVKKTLAIAEATAPETLGAKAAELQIACARLRQSVEAADRAMDGESLALLQVRLADAGAAMASFSASLEGSKAKMTESAAEVTGVFKSISELAQAWSKKARRLTTEPLPR